MCASIYSHIESSILLYLVALALTIFFLLVIFFLTTTAFCDPGIIPKKNYVDLSLPKGRTAFTTVKINGTIVKGYWCGTIFTVTISKSQEVSIATYAIIALRDSITTVYGISNNNNRVNFLYNTGISTYVNRQRRKSASKKLIEKLDLRRQEVTKNVELHSIAI
ncbi:palmitoyltransferase, putative (DHHC8) [Plasmodium ovale curtisi]|uniref:Palmitoyltransferase, putative (DHHC8) n=1 Tax=Plasmodium ovale curtisi TaxID=864141 RepID=A0A1A8WYR1_PLAOA|nr:palmitoyltransferase, putative (DHHC8) [Plasmodium ovale curtisi]SBS98109.1 palmitoyltransferase, putative (DHHC8) [Plasmodium ovale curtisi]